jgi:hypothetical protein
LSEEASTSAPSGTSHTCSPSDTCHYMQRSTWKCQYARN